MSDNCQKGMLKGRPCMAFKNPVYDTSGAKVAYVVQTVPLLPVGPCCADAGPTIQMSIHKAPEYAGTFDEADVARLSLFLFTVTPNLPGQGGGPTLFVGKIANALIAKIGWALGHGQSGVERSTSPWEALNVTSATRAISSRQSRASKSSGRRGPAAGPGRPSRLGPVSCGLMHMRDCGRPERENEMNSYTETNPRCAGP